MTPLPTVILAGFLGAGKTTLLNRLLAEGLSGRRTGVIVNDFGRLNIDRQLVENRAREIIELSSGCLCCSLQPGLIAAVRALAGRATLDLLVIEASGVSVLSALLHVLAAPELAGAIHVGRIVAMIDARRYLSALHDLPVIKDQVAHANLLVLNHCDEADAAVVNAAMLRLERENPAAPVVVAEFANFDLALVLDGAARAPDVGHPEHHHEHWHTYEVKVPGDINAGELLDLVNQLPASVERVKGLVGDGEQSGVLQKVGPYAATLARHPPASGAGLRDTLVVMARAPLGRSLKQIFPRRRGFEVVAATGGAPAAGVRRSKPDLSPPKAYPGPQ